MSPMMYASAAMSLSLIGDAARGVLSHLFCTSFRSEAGYRNNRVVAGRPHCRPNYAAIIIAQSLGLSRDLTHGNSNPDIREIGGTLGSSSRHRVGFVARVATRCTRKPMASTGVCVRAQESDLSYPLSPLTFPPLKREGRVDAASRHPVYPVHPCFVLGSVLPGVWSLVLTLHPEAQALACHAVLWYTILAVRCRRSSAAEQWFRKPPAVGSSPTAGSTMQVWRLYHPAQLRGPFSTGGRPFLSD